MILRRLYELAEWANLLNDLSMVPTEVACAVKVGRKGDFNGLLDLREDREIPAIGKKGKPKTIKTGGMTYPIPIRPVVWDTKAKHWKLTDAAASGAEKPAVFLADTLARVLPIDRLIADAAKKKKENAEHVIAKCKAQRDTFWRFLRYAADDSKDPTLLALAAFGERIATDTGVHTRIQDEIEKAKLPLAAICTLELTADDGNVLTRPGVLEWWRKFYEHDSTTQQAGQFRGLCQVTQQEAPIPTSIQTRINGLGQIDCRAEAYLISGLGSADSYGLKGAQAGMVSAQGVDGFTRALHALIDNQFPSKKDKTRAGGIRSSLRIGSKNRATLFLFWTRDMESEWGLKILDCRPDQFAELLDSLQKFVGASAAIPEEQQDHFRVLTLTGNSARVVVRDYLETPLPRVQKNILKWFDDLLIADTSKEFQGRPNAAFPLWLLANATALDADRVAPDTHTRLMHAALTGGPLPDSILIACLGRLRAEGSDAFRAHRMGLIKLCLTRKGIVMEQVLNKDERHPAYIYGRLLEVFAQIQYAALGDVNANVVDKFYGTFSAAPAYVYGRIVSNAQNHLRKLRGEKPEAHYALERRLTEILELLTPAPPPTQFSLQDQGRFALGFYHEKAKRFEQIAERKADKAAKAQKAAEATQ